MSDEVPRIVRHLPDGDTVLYTWFQAMHTRVDILLKHNGPAADRFMQRAIDEMREVIAALEQAGNYFSPASELYRLNHLPPGERMELSGDLFDILSKCVYYHSVTDGLFDISISSRCHNAESLSWLDLRNDHTAARVSGDLSLNLSGFLKGYALDELRKVSDKLGLNHVLLNMGNSSIMSMGDVPFHLKDACLTTSGNSAGNPRHIINPQSGQYVEGERSVSVVTDSGTDGEVASTVLFVCEPGKRNRLVEVLNVRDFTENVPEGI